jgi:hypothetical protein
MSNRNLLALAATLVIAVTPAIAQEGHGTGDGHGHEMDPQAMQKMMEMMQPGPQHEAMDFWAGTWKANVTNAMTGEESEGTYTFEWALGGRVLVGNFSGTMMGQPYEGMSIDGYDKQSGAYYSLWMDTTTTGYTMFTGKAEGEDTVVYTGTGTDPMTGGEMKMRSVSTRTGDDTFTYTMYVSQGGQEMKVMEMTGTRM